MICKHSKKGIFIPFFLLFFIPLTAAPRNNRPYDDPNIVVINEMRSTLDTMRHQMNNHESEIRVFDEKLANLDSIIESVRDQLTDASKNQKEQLKGSAATLEAKITALETASKGLVADMRQFKTHANESATALAQYKQKLSELEKIINQQNQDIENLQAAITSLVEMFQGKSASTATAAVVDSGDSYRIKAGDSLEKIARAHQTTPKAIKELNGLTSDKIVVGKVLKIPGKQ